MFSVDCLLHAIAALVQLCLENNFLSINANRCYTCVWSKFGKVNLGMGTSLRF
ncbi:hypothetical protein [Nostoc sp.]|uniref:hypothetical protein n=1 Tax=Nostoc sp. TaxID=1180 RepID=UPI002FF708CD